MPIIHHLYYPESFRLDFTTRYYIPPTRAAASANFNIWRKTCRIHGINPNMNILAKENVRISFRYGTREARKRQTLIRTTVQPRLLRVSSNCQALRPSGNRWGFLSLRHLACSRTESVHTRRISIDGCRSEHSDGFPLVS